MSAESLKRKLIPLIQSGYYDDVRCEILIYLKDNPQDEEVWHWCVATARSDEDRIRAVKQWLRIYPNSEKARNIFTMLLERALVSEEPARPNPPLDRTPKIEESFVNLPKISPEVKRIQFGDAPFGANEFIRTLFIGQEPIIDEISTLVEQIKGGANFALMFRAPHGWGKSLLASLILSYLDPSLSDSLYLEARSLSALSDLAQKRFLLIENYFELPDSPQLAQLLSTGAHTAILTSVRTTPLSQPFSAVIRDFSFADYSLGELGLIAHQRLQNNNIQIPVPFMHQIAKFAGGNPEEAVSYAERLALVWRRQEVSSSLGELIYHLNYTLSEQPPDPNFNYIAIWEDDFIPSISAYEILAGLRDRNFPFGLNIRVARSALRFVPMDRRKAQLNHKIVSLPPYLFQKQFNPAGLVADALQASQRKGLVLGAYSEIELAELIEMSGFVFDAQGIDAFGPNHQQPVPDDVQHLVWQRDRGRCVICGNQENLAFEHLIPPSKGGSNTARNVRILCEQCYQSHSDRF